jgi:hypothetical protein
MKQKPIPIQKNADGTYTLNGPMVFSCGCGDTSVKVRDLLKNAGVPWVPLISTPNNNNARSFVKSSGLAEAEPSLLKGKHAVLFHPVTEKYINLLNVPKSEYILSNIYNVASGK